MKLYDSAGAPNPRRVRIFLAEKGIEVPSVELDIGRGETRTPEFRAINPLGTVPVLELDDGTRVAESVAICRYFEEIQPEPPLFGSDAKERALVEMWQRHMELELFGAVTGAFRNTHDFFKGVIPQAPDYGRLCLEALPKRLAWLDEVLADRPFVAGLRFSIADITALVAIDFARVIRVRPDPAQKNLARWHADVSARPSARA